MEKSDKDKFGGCNPSDIAKAIFGRFGQSYEMTKLIDRVNAWKGVYYKPFVHLPKGDLDVAWKFLCEAEEDLGQALLKLGESHDIEWCVKTTGWGDTYTHCGVFFKRGEQWELVKEIC